MVREMVKMRNKTKEDMIKELEVLEKETEEDTEKLKEIINRELELDTAFYFSVVFNDRNERDEFLKKINVELHDNYNVMSADFIKALNIQ